jgi:hypothetical protein
MIDLGVRTPRGVDPLRLAMSRLNCRLLRVAAGLTLRLRVNSALAYLRQSAEPHLPSRHLYYPPPPSPVLIAYTGGGDYSHHQGHSLPDPGLWWWWRASGLPPPHRGHTRGRTSGLMQAEIVPPSPMGKSVGTAGFPAYEDM